MRRANCCGRPDASSGSRSAARSVWNAPWFRAPVRASRSARISAACRASTACTATDAWPAKREMSSISSGSYACGSSPQRLTFSVPMTVPCARSGTTTSASGSIGVPGTCAARGSRCAWFATTTVPLVDRPAREAHVERLLVGQDLLRPAVAREDRDAHAALAVQAVDGDRVVADHGHEGVRDALEDGGGVPGREQRLVHVQEEALAGEASLQLQPAGRGAGRCSARSRAPGRRSRRRSRASSGRPPSSGRRPSSDTTTTPSDRVPVGHRGEEHRLRLVGADDRAARRSRVVSPTRSGVSCCATQPVSPVPTGTRRRSGSGGPSRRRCRRTRAARTSGSPSPRV